MVPEDGPGVGVSVILYSVYWHVQGARSVEHGCVVIMEQVFIQLLCAECPRNLNICALSVCVEGHVNLDGGVWEQKKR